MGFAAIVAYFSAQIVTARTLENIEVRVQVVERTLDKGARFTDRDGQAMFRELTNSIANHYHDKPQGDVSKELGVINSKLDNLISDYQEMRTWMRRNGTRIETLEAEHRK